MCLSKFVNVSFSLLFQWTTLFLLQRSRSPNLPRTSRTGTPDSLLASDPGSCSPGRGVTWSQRSRFLHGALITAIILFYDHVNRPRYYFLHFFISLRWKLLGPSGLGWWWIHQPARIYVRQLLTIRPGSTKPVCLPERSRLRWFNVVYDAYSFFCGFCNV